jgi:hypothetical protein
MVPLPEASFTSVSVSGTSSSAAAARGGGEGDEVSSPLRAPGVRNLEIYRGPTPCRHPVSVHSTSQGAVLSLRTVSGQCHTLCALCRCQASAALLCI